MYITEVLGARIVVLPHRIIKLYFIELRMIKKQSKRKPGKSQIWTVLLNYQTLKSKSCHDGKFVVTGETGAASDNKVASKFPKTYYIYVSNIYVKLKWILREKQKSWWRGGDGGMEL